MFLRENVIMWELLPQLGQPNFLEDSLLICLMDISLN